MQIALVNASLDPLVTNDALALICAAVEDQVNLHYAPLHQSAGATVRVYTSLQAVPQEDGQSAVLLLIDEPDDSGALGWHDVDGYRQGRAFGRIFWNELKVAGATIAQGNLSLSSVISHEVLEMMGNPYVDLWVRRADMFDMPFEACELCDRTQGDSYAINGVSVSNFLGPRAFRDGDGPYDFMGLLKSPWEIRPGGYVIRMTTAGVSQSIWGENVPEWLKLRKERSDRNRRARGLATEGAHDRVGAFRR